MRRIYMKTIKTPKDYQDYVKNKQPKQTILKNCVNAFLWGGGICVLGQFIKDFYLNTFDVSDKIAGGMQSMTLIFIGAFLTTLGIYDNIGKYAGAGSAIPITGFANSVVAPAIEFKKEGYILGVGSKMFSLAGPVLVYGTITSIIIGLLYYFMK